MIAGAKRRGRASSFAFRSFLLLSLIVALTTLAVLVGQVLVDSQGFLDTTLLTSPPSALPEIAGARPAILASLYLGALVFLFSVPIGVATAVYLEEYAAKDRWYNRLLELNIQNLAGVPSIVYGILGLAFLVRGLGLGRTLLAGSLILTLLVLPTVIIASREALRSVPSSIRDGAYALGATPWQVTWRQVLPAAIPGIATGSILSLSRPSQAASTSSSSRSSCAVSSGAPSSAQADFTTRRPSLRSALRSTRATISSRNRNGST